MKIKYSFSDWEENVQKEISAYIENNDCVCHDYTTGTRIRYAESTGNVYQIPVNRASDWLWLDYDDIFNGGGNIIRGVQR